MRQPYICSPHGAHIVSYGRNLVQVASDLMVAGLRLQRRFDFGADGHGKGTAGMKAAAGRRIERTWDLACENDILALFIGVSR